MKVIREVQHAACKITIFSWNNRYLIKLEQGLLEQTFKVNALDVTDEADLLKILDDAFLQQALDNFNRMGQTLYEARRRAEI